MVDFSKKNTKESGGKFADKDWTVNSARWLVNTFKTGFTGIMYEWQATDGAGNDETIQWLLGDADKLNNKLVVNDDGQLEDVDDDNKYQPRTQDPTSQLFNSMEDAGVPLKLLNNIGAAPDGVVGYIFHLVDKPTGKKQMKKLPDGTKVETQYDQTWLIVESIVDSPPKKGAKAGSGKPAVAAAAASATKPVSAKKTKPVVEEEPDEDDQDETENDGLDPITEAAVATIQNVLSSPKKFVLTFNAKQNGGGVTMAQMRSAAIGNGIPKEHKAAGKSDVGKMLGKPDVYVQYDGELWNFDADEGVVSALEE